MSSKMHGCCFYFGLECKPAWILQIVAARRGANGMDSRCRYRTRDRSGEEATSDGTADLREVWIGVRFMHSCLGPALSKDSGVGIRSCGYYNHRERYVALRILNFGLMGCPSSKQAPGQQATDKPRSAVANASATTAQKSAPSPGYGAKVGTSPCHHYIILIDYT